MVLHRIRFLYNLVLTKYAKPDVLLSHNVGKSLTKHKELIEIESFRKKVSEENPTWDKEDQKFYTLVNMNIIQHQSVQNMHDKIDRQNDDIQQIINYVKPKIKQTHKAQILRDPVNF